MIDEFEDEDDEPIPFQIKFIAMALFWAVLMGLLWLVF